MTIGQARAIALRWTLTSACTIPGFCGAYTAGSTNWLSEDAAMPVASDLDIMIVVDSTHPTATRHKFLFESLLIEASYLSKSQFQAPAEVLSDYHLAPSLQTANIFADPTNILTPLVAAVRAAYAQEHWVRRRCLNAQEKILQHLRSIDRQTTPHDRVIACLFAAGIATHVLLVAGLQNPTVRSRYSAVRPLLVRYGHLKFHDRLLHLLGSAHISIAQARHHLDMLTALFDIAESELRTPVPFQSDLSHHARAIAIDSSAQLIEHGSHREAMFWIAVTATRCMQVLSLDAPRRLTRKLEDGYHDLLTDLGLASLPEIDKRRAEIENFLPQLWNMAERIVAANQKITERSPHTHPGKNVSG